MKEKMDGQQKLFNLPGVYNMFYWSRVLHDRSNGRFEGLKTDFVAWLVQLGHVR